jgi:hypothetical protein
VSSAILYLAIVGIWAVVLLPQWVGRDSCSSGDEFTTAELDAAHGEEETAAPAARR